MKATLYEALGIPPAASDEEVRAALRRLIRKYYAKTRDGQGNVEEALRFINHASRILGDHDRRVRYDEELAVSSGTTEQRIAHVVTNAVAADGEQTDVPPPEAEIDPDEILETGLDTADAHVARNLHHPGLTERVASFGRSRLATFLVCAMFGAFIAAAIAFVTPSDTVLVAKQVLVWLTLTLLGLTIIYGVVHGIAWARRRGGSPGGSLLPQTALAILNWRREKSVFLGTNQPQEDASWIFQLRMAELERAKAGRTSEPRPWSRLGARLFDYAIWGLVLALLLSELRALGAVPDAMAAWLGHPLLAPMIITGTWVIVEALLIASVQTTPGKWLFGCYLQFSISDAYAPRDLRSQIERALKRSFRVWWEGVGCGFALLAPILIAVAYEKLAQDQETDWDFAQDCLVTHGPPGVLNTVTGVCGLAAMLWLYGVAWHQPMADSIAWARTSITEALPSARSLLPAGFTSGNVITAVSGGISTPAAPPATIASNPPSPSADPIDPTIATQFADRRARIAMLKVEGPRMLQAGNSKRAMELCRAWTDIDLSNADAWRCYGSALQAQGYHQDAISAFRKAKQFDPNDRTLDAAIDRSQRGIVADFLNRYRK